MNKIVIIGNGFDLAHGLPTRYGDFMEYLSNSIISIDRRSRQIVIHGTEVQYERESSFAISYGNNSIIPKYDKIVIRNEKNGQDKWIGAEYNASTRKVELKAVPNSNSIYFHSLFNKYFENGRWSDLESHYYEQLLIFKENIEGVETINKEFDHLKKLLKEYLLKEVEEKISANGKYKIDETHNIFNIFKQHSSIITYLLPDEYDQYFISFNYTGEILKKYVDLLRQSGLEIPLDPIHIHGDLINNDNPIIFGYGDDNSEEYKQIQDLKESKLLKNFKTFQYLRSNRYRQVLGILSMEKKGDITDSYSDEGIYVQVIGHSLDIGDRTLLKTIFQHPNVKHIELTYHENERNYFENLYNVSRIFDDNTLMREKIIPLEDTHNITTGMTLNQKKALEKQN